MADNLTIEAGVNLANVRADLELMKRMVRESAADMRKETGIAAVTGDKAHLVELAAHHNSLLGSQKALNAQLAVNHKETESWKHTARELKEQFEEIHSRFHLGFGGLTGLAGLATGLGPVGLAAAGVAAVVGGMYELAHNAGESAHHIVVMSHALGVSTGQMKAWRTSAKDAEVETEVLDKNFERLGISIEKTADEQRKLRIETAQTISADMGVAARGGRSDKPRAPFKGIYDSPGLQKDSDSLKKFSESERNTLLEVNKLREKAGQAPFPVLSPDAFRNVLRNKMAEDTPEAEALKQAYTKAFGDDAPIKSWKEGLERTKPGFKDIFREIGVDVLDATNKIIGMDEVLRKVSIAGEHLDPTKKLKWSKDAMGRGSVDPEFQHWFWGPEARESFDAAPFDDPKIKQGDEFHKFEFAMKREAEKRLNKAGLWEIGKGTAAWEAMRAEAEGAANLAGNLAWPGSVIEGGIAKPTGTFADFMHAGEAALPSSQALGLFTQGPGLKDFGLDKVSGLAESIKNALGTAISTIGEEANRASSTLGTMANPAALQAGVSQEVGILDGLAQRLRSLTQDARETSGALGAVLGGGGTGVGTGGDYGGGGTAVYATGGYIRGPGSGTSDSILARLSNGEYVMSAAAVRRLGLGALNAMNFGRYLPRFAAGGMVGGGSIGGGGTPVHIHLGDKTYETSASPSVAAALAHEARSRLMLRTGAKPSWAGA